VHGKTGGLRASQHSRLQRLYRRRISGHEIISHELTRQISSISHDIKRQVALLITRKGKIAYVSVGNANHISIPDLSQYRIGSSRLKGLRCIHTHLNGEPFSEEDITDLVLLGLDLMVCVQVDGKGIPGPISYANVLPMNRDGKGWIINQVADIGQLNVDFLELVHSLETELARTRSARSLEKKDRALLVGVTTGPRWQEEGYLDELAELAVSDNIEVVGRVVQFI
jgi:GTP-binding protein HflX